MRVGYVVFIIVTVVQFTIVVFEVGVKRYETKKGCIVILRQQMFGK